MSATVPGGGDLAVRPPRPDERQAVFALVTAAGVREFAFYEKQLRPGAELAADEEQRVRLTAASEARF